MEGVRLGAYQLRQELGSGGMGRVYRAEVVGPVPGLEAGRVVALKVVHPHLLQSPGFLERFLREARIGQEVRHDNVVHCLDCAVHREDGRAQHFLVMEYVEGQTLRDLLGELVRVPEELCRHIGGEVAKGLAAIHAAGAVHRDLKPENVLITRTHEIKIMDLGLARLVDEATRLSQTGQFVGSVLYAAPEALRGHDVDGRVDLHGLGLVLYELATGHQPFRHDDVQVVLRRVLETEPRRAGELNPQLSPFFEEVLHTLLQKDVDARFRAAADLLEVFEAGEASAWWKEHAAAIRRTTRKPLRRIRIPRETAVYGRDDDLAWLQEAYEKAQAGDGQVLLVEGEAGIGKTRLVDELVGRLERGGEDVNFLFGSYPPGGAATASGAWSTAYREHLGAEGSAPWLADTPRLVSAFDALLRGEPPPPDAQLLTKDSLQTVFVHVTRALAAQRPTVVLIEDLHLAPEEGRALFASLALAVPGHRVLLIATMRPELAESWVAGLTRFDQVDHRTLSRLGAKDLSLLLEDAFHSERLAEELGGKIARKSDGNPFFAFEIVRGLKEGQFLTQKPDGSWVSTGAIGDLQVPSSVLDLVNVRVADLVEQDRDLLDVASCVGFHFDPSLVGAAAGLPQIAALKRFGQIERRHRLVRSLGRAYVFDHHQVQEALHAGLNDQLREAYHGRIAETLEDREDAGEKDPQDLDGALCVKLCGHYLEAGRGENALRYLDAALTHLGKGYLNELAVELGERALAVPGLLAGVDRVAILLRVVDRLDLLARREAQHRTCQDALALSREIGDRRGEVRALEKLALAHRVQGHFEQARALYEEQLELATEIGDARGRAEATLQLGHVLGSTGHPKEALERGNQALVQYRALGDLKGEADAAGRVGQLLMVQAEYGAATEHLERSLALARELGDLRAQAAATSNLGGCLWYQGRFDEASVLIESVHDICRQTGDRHGEALSWGNLGLIQQNASNYGKTLEYLERSLALSREIDDRQGIAGALIPIASVYSVVCASEQAWQMFEECRAICAEIGDQRLHVWALCGLGAIASDLERYRESVEWFERAIALTRETSDEMGLAMTLPAQGEALILAGRRDEALPVLKEGLEAARKVGAGEALTHALIQLTLLSPEYLEEAIATTDELAGSVGRTRLMESRRTLWNLTGDKRHLVEAKQLLDHQFEHTPEEHHKAMREASGLQREIVEAWEEHGDPALLEETPGSSS